MSGCDPEDFDTIEYKDGVKYINGKIDEDVPTINKIIARQLKFVDWLKKNNIYNPLDTPLTMLKMQAVWEINTEIENCLKESLEHQVANLGKESIEFYTCYTYNRGCFPDWVTKAKKLLKMKH